MKSFAPSIIPAVFISYFPKRDESLLLKLKVAPQFEKPKGGNGKMKIPQERFENKLGSRQKLFLHIISMVHVDCEHDFSLSHVNMT